MPRGGRRPGAGRKKGSISAPKTVPSAPAHEFKAADKKLSDYAQEFRFEAIDQLVKLGRQRKTPHGARVQAWREVLDRSEGRPAQAITASGGDPLIPAVTRVIHEFTDGDSGPSV